MNGILQQPLKCKHCYRQFRNYAQLKAHLDKTHIRGGGGLFLRRKYGVVLGNQLSAVWPWLQGMLSDPSYLVYKNNNKLVNRPSTNYPRHV
jgi:hypothetical protein